MLNLHQARIGIRSELDRETLVHTSVAGKAEHKLGIVVYDHGTPSMSATTTLTIHVDDINDSPPVFERSRYEISVSEAMLAGTPIITVSAKDEDLPENTELYYSLVDQAQGISQIRKYF